nr:hypothetical protein [uncultured Acetatifactor sp.]
MKIILRKSSSLTDLEETVNKDLEELEYAASAVKGITYATHTIPKMRGKEIVAYDVFYSVMITYEE